MASQEIANDLSLHQCIISRNKARLISILDSDVDINKLDNRGRASLHVAASEHYQEGVELLLERGADVNVKCRSGDTPLHEGINNYEVVKTLLDEGALPDCRNGRGQTPLFIAVRNKNLPIINLLLSGGANIDLRNFSGNSPLHEAVSNGSHEIIKVLLDHGANIEAKCKQGSTPLHISASLNDCITTQLLLDMGANPNVTDEHVRSPEESYFKERGQKSLKAFILTTFGNTPLHIAANNEYPSIIKVLLDGGANPDIKNAGGSTPFHISVYLSDFRSARLLLEKGVNVNIKATHLEIAPLYLAIISGKELLTIATSAPEDVECLLQAGAKVNAQDRSGNTPLHYIVGISYVLSLKVVQILLDWGASVKLTNKKGETALDLACAEQLDFIKKHFIKLMPLNGSQFEVNVITDLKGYESFHTSCLEELGLMKKKKCGKYSFFDIFYLYNDPFYVTSITMEKELSLIHVELRIYASLLKVTFKKAKKRFSAMSKLVECFNVNCLPVELKWKILTYLSDENLEYILKIVETSRHVR